MTTRLDGEHVTLRPASASDIEALAVIRSTPEVRARWRGGETSDITAEIAESLEEKGLRLLVIEDRSGVVVGAIQWAASEDPEYLHASVDMFLDPAVHGRGWGTDAVSAPRDRGGLPPTDDRPRGRQRYGDPLLRKGWIPARRCDARVRTWSRRNVARLPADGPIGRRTPGVNKGVLRPRAWAVVRNGAR
jgi:Acetyltransferase (GNAT) domain